MVKISTDSISPYLLCQKHFSKPLNDDCYEKNPNVQQHFQKICELLNDAQLLQTIKTFGDLLQKLELTEESYILAIRSSLKSPKLFLKRGIEEIRINSYNELLLRAWEANIDVQFILDGYACASYLVSYVSKSQKGMSNLLHDACEEAKKGNLSLKQQVRQIGNKFLTHVEICAQEAAYLLLQMPLRSSSRTVVFINTSEPAKRTFLLKSFEALQELPEGSTDIETDNWIKRYQRRPRLLQKYCLAAFVSSFDVVRPSKDKQNQRSDFLPEDEFEEVNEDEADENDAQENNLIFEKEYPMNDGSILRLRKTSKIIRYVRYNKEQDPENYFREQLMLFYPWRKEEIDLKEMDGSYETCYQNNVEIILTN